MASSVHAHHGGPTAAMSRDDAEDEASLLRTDDAMPDDSRIPAPGFTPAARRRRYVQVGSHAGGGRVVWL